MIKSVNGKPRSQLDAESATLSETLPNTLPRLVDRSVNRAHLIRRILQRIEARLPGRIRELSVTTTDNGVVLSGLCSTYYTKQIAQHAAMGALEYERLINNIDVRTVK